MTNWSAPAPDRTTSRLIGAASCQGSSPASMAAGLLASFLAPGELGALEPDLAVFLTPSALMVAARRSWR
jgi:hypothetical protein